MNWDQYFLNVCNAVASKSPCLSRNIGAIIVRDHSIISTGYNGPARGYPHCKGTLTFDGPTSGCVCPRHIKGYKSGEGLLECPAAHAEANCIANAAKLGVSVNGATLYLNTFEVPCKDCMTAIVNAGISEVVSKENKPYHQISFDIAKFGNVKLRRFEI